jgi:hypothetical protein
MDAKRLSIHSLAAFASGGRGRLVVWSPGAWRYVAFRQPGTLKLVDDDATRKQFNRPGLLAKVWKGAK